MKNRTMAFITPIHFIEQGHFLGIGCAVLSRKTPTSGQIREFKNRSHDKPERFWRLNRIKSRHRECPFHDTSFFGSKIEMKSSFIQRYNKCFGRTQMSVALLFLILPVESDG